MKFWRKMNKKKILVVASHPDDEILGCGGTIARLVSEGHEAHTLILGEGITSRDTDKSSLEQAEELKNLRRDAERANKLIGVKNTIIYNLADNRFDSVPLLEVVKVIEKCKEEIKPDIIFTQYGRDLNIDHQVTYQAVLVATRPIPSETVKEIYSFEVMSSTEWNFPLSFSPDLFFDITKTIDLKKKAMDEYKTEIREFPHPRSVKSIELNAELWGVRVGVPMAEAFKTVRSIK